MSKDPPGCAFGPPRKDFAQETTSREVGIFAALAEARARLGGGGILPFSAPKTHVMDDKSGQPLLAVATGTPRMEVPSRDFWGRMVPPTTPLVLGSRESSETSSDFNSTENTAMVPENSAKMWFFMSRP